MELPCVKYKIANFMNMEKAVEGLEKLKTELPRDPAVLLLAVYLKNENTSLKIYAVPCSLHVRRTP